LLRSVISPSLLFSGHSKTLRETVVRRKAPGGLEDERISSFPNRNLDIGERSSFEATTMLRADRPPGPATATSAPEQVIHPQTNGRPGRSPGRRQGTGHPRVRHSVHRGRPRLYLRRDPREPHQAARAERNQGRPGALNENDARDSHSLDTGGTPSISRPFIGMRRTTAGKSNRAEFPRRQPQHGWAWTRFGR
jgi:hypothetical protein